MFGRKPIFGSKAAAGSAPPPVPPAQPSTAWVPQDKIDAALDAAIRLFTEALRQAGLDCGQLGLGGNVPAGVAAMLADCVVYPGKDGDEFLTLGITPDFRAFSYQPHCRLFMILNAVGILEDLEPSPLRSEIARFQLARPLVDAHLMRRWIRYIRPAGNALAGGDADALRALLRPLAADLDEVTTRSPRWIAERLDVVACAREWSSGFPGTIGRPIDGEVRRLNGLPMTEFVDGLIREYLAQVQAEGLRAKYMRA